MWTPLSYIHSLGGKFPPSREFRMPEKFTPPHAANSRRIRPRSRKFHRERLGTVTVWLSTGKRQGVGEEKREGSHRPPVTVWLWEWGKRMEERSGNNKMKRERNEEWETLIFVSKGVQTRSGHWLGVWLSTPWGKMWPSKYASLSNEGWATQGSANSAHSLFFLD